MLSQPFYYCEKVSVVGKLEAWHLFYIRKKISERKLLFLFSFFAFFHVQRPVAVLADSM